MSFYVLHLTASRSDIHNVTLIHMYANTLVSVTIHISYITTQHPSHQHDIEGSVELLFTVYTVNMEPYKIT